MLNSLLGGNVALRGIGMAVFARAFLYCKHEDIDFDEMVSQLAQLGWHLLSCERSDLPTGPTYASEVQKKALPMWSHLLVIGESRYRVMAWQKILGATFEKFDEAA